MSENDTSGTSVDDGMRWVSTTRLDVKAVFLRVTTREPKLTPTSTTERG